MRHFHLYGHNSRKGRRMKKAKDAIEFLSQKVKMASLKIEFLAWNRYKHETEIDRIIEERWLIMYAIECIEERLKANV